MDLLVKLYDLPLRRQNSTELPLQVRRALAPELLQVAAWVNERFGMRWASEVHVAFARQPASCFLAIRDKTLLGFACYDATARGFFGPTGVAEEARGQGAGTALLFACLEDMRALGYGYAVIGAAGPVDYYVRTAGAIPIPESSPGVYRGLLPRG